MFEICQSKFYVYIYSLPYFLTWLFSVLVLIKINYCLGLLITPCTSHSDPRRARLGCLDREAAGTYPGRTHRYAHRVSDPVKQSIETGSSTRRTIRSSEDFRTLSRPHLCRFLGRRARRRRLGTGLQASEKLPRIMKPRPASPIMKRARVEGSGMDARENWTLPVENLPVGSKALLQNAAGASGRNTPVKQST